MDAKERAAAEHLKQSDDPALASAEAAGWSAWLMRLARFGRHQLAKLGAVLVLGFLLALGAMLAFAELADEVMEQETLVLDNAAGAWLRQFGSPGLDSAMHALSAMGSEAVMVLLPLATVLLCWRKRYGAAVSLLFAVAGAQLLNNVLKDLFQRTRPAPVESFISAQQFSFPSGHAMVSAAFYVFVAYLAWRLLHGRARYLATAALFLLVVAIGVSRIYLQAHYLSDVLAGYAAGFLWVEAVILGGRMLAPRLTWRRSGPAREAVQT